ncbi:DUF4238 domain-containing protein [Rhodanobacter sp. T12-5]|uniref:DUF4238 domain-containing protein n=1 Tax=Rhodanobacter sp. T12-5 TaxID=2024611 RepID=UPI001F5B11B3|nr:DUF4238 domain-containing protein [Rhodanobacter sp. T12-5]
MRDKEPFLVGLMNIAQESYFYEVKEISDDEANFLEKVFEQPNQSPMLKKINQNWVQIFKQPSTLKCELERRQLLEGEVAQQLKDACRQSGEDLQGAIENMGRPGLDFLKNGDVSFWKNEDDRMAFQIFLCSQYFRTRRRREAVLSETKGAAPSCVNVENIVGPIMHMAATTVAFSMLRKPLDLYLLRNATSEPLITGDQPVINTHASDLGGREEVTELQFYYPISPTLAVLLSEEVPDNSGLTLEKVRDYNRQMHIQADSQTFANGEAALLPYKGMERQGAARS